MLISVRELAEHLGVSSKTIYAMVEREQIPFFRVGTGRGTLRFDAEAVKKLLAFSRPSKGDHLTKVSTRHLR